MLWFSSSPTVSENATHGLFVLGSSFVSFFVFSETAFQLNLDYESVRNENWGLVLCVVFCKVKSILVHCRKLNRTRDWPQLVSLKFPESCSLWASGREASTHPRASRQEALREKNQMLHFVGTLVATISWCWPRLGPKHTDDPSLVLQEWGQQGGCSGQGDS